MTETLSPQETVRLAIVVGAAGLVGFSFLIIFMMVAIHGLMRKGQPPKYLRDWADKLLAALIGLIVGVTMTASQPKANPSPHSEPAKTAVPKP